jgi:predicted dithiol-disulfide oxidoreductase (DUF899 family)
MSTSKPVVTREAWTEARKALLAKEKAFTRERDAVSAARRAMPMVKIDNTYVFEEASGKRSLEDLFAGKRQLVIYHFMMGATWDAGCKSCSFIADHFEPSVVHLAARDTALVAVSHAPLSKIEPFQKRMGWTFRWLSSAGSDFNYDFHVSARPEEADGKKPLEYNYVTTTFPSEEMPGLSVFLREDGATYHTYSTYGRGLDMLIGAYNYLDLTPLGRQEEGLKNGMEWVRHHDRYAAG